MSRRNIVKLKNTVISMLVVLLLSCIFELGTLYESIVTNVYASTFTININSADMNDVANPTLLAAISTDGGTEGSFTKNQHIDSAFDAISLSTITSATLYYDSYGTMDGTWGVYLKDARDGNTICSVDPAPEDVSETRNSISCSITTTQLSNGVWFYAINNDTAGPEYIYIDYVYLSIEGTAGVSISLTTDGSVAFGNMDLNTTRDTTAGDLNDVETVSVDTGPANLTVKSTTFSDGSNTWSLSSSNGSDTVLFEYSKEGSSWNTFLVPDTSYTLENNVAQGNTQDLYLRLTTPTTTSSYLQHGSTVTITASVP